MTNPIRPVSKPTPPIVKLEAMVIEGTVRKPMAFYILNRTQPSVSLEELKPESFLPKILQSVHKRPF